MSLEARSGPKTLLKLLLDKTNDVLTQSKDNKLAIERLHDKDKELDAKLLLIIQQLELISGEIDYHG